MDVAALAQLIAKIARGFAVWQFGLDGFVPMLTNLILHDFNTPGPHPDQFQLVGGDLRTFAPHTDRLHTLGWGFLEGHGKTYLLVAVRLFSYLGGPIYYAVTGSFTEEQLTKARAVSKVHAQASDKDRDRTLKALEPKRRAAARSFPSTRANYSGHCRRPKTLARC